MLKSTGRPGVFPGWNHLLLTFVSPRSDAVAGSEQALRKHSQNEWTAMKSGT